MAGLVGVAALEAGEQAGAGKPGAKGGMAKSYMERANAFAGRLRDTYADVLVSVVLYGSAARGEFEEGVSDLNMLVLLRDTGPATLRRGSGMAREWAKQGNPPPLILGADEWSRSADAFPIEFADIQAAHRILHGADPFADVVVDREHLRLQCEHELKGKQIQLREGFLLTAEQPKELGTLLVGSFSTFLVLFRTVLRLAGAPVSHDAEDTIAEAARRVGFDPEPLREILLARRAKTPIKPKADSPLVTGYLDAVARTVEFVDRLPAA